MLSHAHQVPARIVRQLLQILSLVVFADLALLLPARQAIAHFGYSVVSHSPHALRFSAGSILIYYLLRAVVVKAKFCQTVIGITGTGNRTAVCVGLARLRLRSALYALVTRVWLPIFYRDGVAETVICKHILHIHILECSVVSHFCQTVIGIGIGTGVLLGVCAAVVLVTRSAAS